MVSWKRCNFTSPRSLGVEGSRLPWRQTSVDAEFYRDERHRQAKQHAKTASTPGERAEASGTTRTKCMSCRALHTGYTEFQHVLHRRRLVLTTPRHFRLIRTLGLASFQQAIVALAVQSDPWRARQTAVLVPTAAAGTQLSRAIETDMVADAAAPSVRVVPFLLTRDQWYRELHARLDGSVSYLSALERHVCMLSSARQAQTHDAAPPFKLRPGLIPAVVSFYDQLRRHRTSVDAFDRSVTTDLEPSVDLDRGARRLLRQTRFLVATFRRYESRLDALGCVDEHRLRSLFTGGATTPFTRVVVTVPDHVVDPSGLWPADYDLLTWLPGLEQLDVVATERVLDSGFYERIVDLLPGLQEERVSHDSDRRTRVVVPPEGDQNHFVWRDREEELLAVARSVKASARHGRDGPGDDVTLDRRVGVVFRRPLPYLYLARRLFRQGGLPFETLDALPLAAEPYAAALDLVCSFVTSGYDRAAAVALLRSPHFDFESGGKPLDIVSVHTLDQMLRGARYSGGRAALSRLVTQWRASGRGDDAGRHRAAADVASLVLQLAERLQPLENDGPPSILLNTLATFLTRYATRRIPPEPVREREVRARRAVWTAVDELRRAHTAIDDTPASFAEVVAMLRRWIETQTFEPRTGTGGVQLVDARTAAYGRYDDLFIIGLVDGEWPERPARTVLYPPALLIPLGWPRERDILRGARATFRDLLALPVDGVTLSTVSLENDATVTPSSLLEEADDPTFARLASDVDPAVCVTQEDAMACAAVTPGDIPGSAARWLAMRTRDHDWRAPRFRGAVGSREPTTYAVRSLEQYLDCPFKYFADRVLRLGEEPDDERQAAPLRRGLLLHRVFETFFRQWHDSGYRSIAVTNLDDARSMFRQLAEAALLQLPVDDRAVSRSWIFGSAAASGLADRLFQLEVSRPADVVERLTEFRVDGTFLVGTGEQGRRVRLRGVVDRVDLFSDGTFRVVDYKANRAPNRARSLQLPLYVRSVEQQLSSRGGQVWRAVDAAYVAFGEPRLQVPLGRRGFAKAVTEGERRALDVLDQIERGDYPVRPAELYRCTYCPYPTVCRKDYVGDE